MVRAGARRRLAAKPRKVGNRPEPRDDAVEHRDVDLLAFTGFRAMHEREQDALRCVHRRSNIDDGDRHFADLVGRPGQRE